MNTVEKIIYYLFTETFLKNFIENRYWRFVHDTKLKNFIKVFCDFYIKYNSIPKYEEFIKMIEGQPEANEFSILFMQYKRSMVSESYKFLIDEMKKEFTKLKVTDYWKAIDPANVNLKDLTYKLSRLEQALDDESETKQRFIYEALSDRMDRIDRALNMSTILTRYDQFDKYTGGLNKKELYLFFGRSGIGKTRVLFNFAYQLSEQNYTGMYFSLEMYLEQMERIFDSRVSGINSYLIKSGKVDKEHYKYALDSIADRKFPIMFIEHTGKATLSWLAGKIRDFKKNSILDYVVVDYLNLMSDEDDNSRKDEALGAISKGLKNIAKQENIIMITAAQGNRQIGVTEKEGGQVGLDHISQSDLIAHHCDFVAYVQRGKVVDGQLKVSIVKNREGENNKTMIFQIDFATNKMTDELKLKPPTKGDKPFEEEA